MPEIDGVARFSVCLFLFRGSLSVSLLVGGFINSGEVSVDFTDSTDLTGSTASFAGVTGATRESKSGNK